MNFSFDQFAYKKKPSVLTINDSSDESDDVVCTDGQVKNVELVEDTRELFNGFLKREVNGPLIESDANERSNSCKISVLFLTKLSMFFWKDISKLWRFFYLSLSKTDNTCLLLFNYH